MKLYYFPGACSLASHIVARELGMKLDLAKVDLATHKVEDGTDYYSVSPRGYVPLLVLDSGEKVTESSAILQHFADTARNLELLPAVGTLERLRVLQWLGFVSTELHKTFSPFLFAPGTAESTTAAIKEKLAKRFKELDQHLASRPYLTGNTFTIADAYAFTIVNWANFVNIDLAPYPNLLAFQKRVAARPKVAEALKAEGLAA